MPHTQDITALAAVLGAAVLCGLFMNRLRLPAVAGFILAGVVLGPTGIGLIAPSSAIETLAELGVLMLLFIIGMELRLANFRAQLPLALGIAVAEIGVTTGLAALAAQWDGERNQERRRHRLHAGDLVHRGGHEDGRGCRGENQRGRQADDGGADRAGSGRGAAAADRQRDGRGRRAHHAVRAVPGGAGAGAAGRLHRGADAGAELPLSLQRILLARLRTSPRCACWGCAFWRRRLRGCWACRRLWARFCAGWPSAIRRCGRPPCARPRRCSRSCSSPSSSRSGC